MILVEFFNRQQGGNFLAILNRQQVYDRLAATDAAALWHLVDLQPIHTTAIGKTQNVVVGVGNKQIFDEIIFLGAHRLLAASTALLRAVFNQQL